jgi:tyrosine decarboxylase / aspartate 1-decarboxylase
LEDCRKAALDLHQRLEKDERFVTAFPPELDIVVFAPRAESVSESSENSRKIFAAAARRNLHLAVAELPVELFGENLRRMKKDRESVTCLRSVLMKPEHREWIGRIWEILGEATEEVVGKGSKAVEPRSFI